MNKVNRVNRVNRVDKVKNKVQSIERKAWSEKHRVKGIK